MIKSNTKCKEVNHGTERKNCWSDPDLSAFECPVIVFKPHLNSVAHKELGEHKMKAKI